MELFLTQPCLPPPPGLMYSFLKPVPKQQEYVIQSIGRTNDTDSQQFTNNINKASECVDPSAVRANANHELMNTGENARDGKSTDIKFIDYFEQIGDRRKRRKISTEPDGQATSNVADVNADSQGNDASQPSATTEKDVIVVAKNPSDSTSATPKISRGRPPKSTTLKQQVLLPSNVVVQMSNDEEDRTEKSASPRKGRSIRRNGTKLEATGQLSSPNTEPACITSAQTLKPTTIASARGEHGGRKMTLKNGKFAKSLVVVLKYSQVSHGPSSLGNRVLSILSGPSKAAGNKDPNRVDSNSTSMNGTGTKITHPFFLAKSGHQTTTSTPNTQDDLETRKPVAWKDIIFKNIRTPTLKEVQLDKAPWPSVAYQHIRGNEVNLSTMTPNQQSQEKKKDKVKPIGIIDSENIVNIFATDLLNSKYTKDNIHLPRRLYMSRQDALAKSIIGDSHIQGLPIMEAARNSLLSAHSAFDRAEAAGPISWTQLYCPSKWTEVLQPSCNSLYDWLKSLAVHTVKQGLDVSLPKRPVKRRKRLKKKDDDLLDFIVSDDEQQTDVKKVKNAILIVGPNGCGKTAAVYAVAKQLGFEVFEIHSGMRRSQKDILDKVGDMAQNHMVQRGQTASRDSSVVHDVENPSGNDDFSQPSVANMFAQSVKNKPMHTAKGATATTSRQEQKQSLILFEEVDQLFDDDRGFWSGVQGLIQNSKRPVVLTCNTLHGVPLDELDLHDILTFTAPPAAVVVPYLSLMAATEGHLIAAGAIDSMYRDKNYDLRATINNLDFWCQMTVGSEKGGLDWYPSTNERINMTGGGHDVRTFSANTFQQGLDLYPTDLPEFEDQLKYAEDCFNLEPEHFIEILASSSENTDAGKKMAALDRFQLCSDGDILFPSAKRLLCTQLWQIETSGCQAMGRGRMLSILGGKKPFFETSVSYDCLLPLASERPVFPPSQGRLAPSLDLPRSNIATDIAPYVRSIASFDQRLEQARDELFSSQGKKPRTTRAARAAVEGGDKASTRRERWFPKDLDLQAVVATGNSWPQWREGQMPPEIPTSSPCESVEGLIEE